MLYYTIYNCAAICGNFMLHIMIYTMLFNTKLLSICLCSLVAVLTLVKLIPALLPAQLQSFHSMLISLAPFSLRLLQPQIPFLAAPPVAVVLL